jgi:hypothetical protein
MVHSKKMGGIGDPTTFQFQYLPRLGMLTELGVDKRQAEHSASAGFSNPMVTLKKAVLAVGTIAGAVAAVSLVRFVGVSSIPRHLLSAVLAQQSLIWAE